jgi:hypothetical protein
MDSMFPKGFEAFDSFAPEWVLNGPLERQRKRAASDIPTLKAFFDAIYPEIDRIIGYLNTKPIDNLAPADKNLYRLAATWMEMSHPIDLDWRESDEPGIFPFERVGLVEPSPGD